MLADELNNNPDLWISTEDLNLETFDHIQKKINAPFLLKKKNSDSVYFGHYNIINKSFECYDLQKNKEVLIKREKISFFISLPPLIFKHSTKLSDYSDNQT